MPNFKKVDCSEIKLGMRFSMPVFFDDGKNMFLAKKHTVKKYHLNAINQWNLEYLLTGGEVLPDTSEGLEKDFAAFAKANYDTPTDVEDLEELEELEELDEVDGELEAI